MKEDNLDILFDSNTIIDCLTKRNDSEDSIECFLLMASGKYNGYIVSKQITDIYYVLRKYFNEEARREIISKLLTIFNVVDLTKDELYGALAIQNSDYEDCVLASCAITEKMDYILTKDKKGFNGAQVKTISPQNLLKIL